MTKLLLDEMLPASIAEQLVTAGLDVRAVSADPQLRGSSDMDLLEWATAEGRALVTDNIRDFMPLHAKWSALGRTHGGLLFISSKAYPQNRTRTGRIVAALRVRAERSHRPTAGQYDFL